MYFWVSFWKLLYLQGVHTIDTAHAAAICPLDRGRPVLVRPIQLAFKWKIYTGLQSAVGKQVNGKW